VEIFRLSEMSRLLRMAGLAARLGLAGGTVLVLHQHGVWGDASQVWLHLKAILLRL
jgi:hypothetical protein